MGNASTAVAALVGDAARNWVADHAQSKGAARAFYAIFWIAPLRLIVIAVIGVVLGERAARGETCRQLQGMLGAAATAAPLVAGKFLIGLYIGRSGITSPFGAAAIALTCLRTGPWP